ncbi:MAG: omptin family outer membrane protease [Spirochaetaceae bacterium]|jgi:outer membrane protease|nr:omptin family outer membrane protease [Spirochaetaceae bacterium]
MRIIPFLVALVISFIIPSALFGDYHFSFATGAGFLSGVSDEIVYQNTVDDTVLSRLSWAMKPLYYVSVTLNYAPVDPFKRVDVFLDLSCKFGFEGMTGAMEDRDWQDYDDSTALTNYSVHDNYTKNAFLFDGDAGFLLPLGSRYLFKVFGSFSYMTFSWNARNGYLQYAKTTNGFYDTSMYPWSASLPKKYLYGPVISYSQQWISAASGLSFSMPFLQVFTVELGLKIGTVLYCAGVDDHYLRQLQFNDFSSGGILVEPKLLLSFSKNKHLAVLFSTSYRSIQGTQGVTYYRQTGYQQNAAAGTIFKSSGGSGASFAVADTGFILTLSF